MKTQLKINNKLYALSLIMVLFAGIGFGYALIPVAFQHGHVRATANLYIFVERAGGADGFGPSVACIAIGNTLTAGGEAYAESWLGGCGELNTTARNATQWISWGNSSIATSKTILDTEATTGAFNRTVATVSAVWSNGGHNARNFTVSVTCNETININACALHWSGVLSSNNNAYALAALPQATTFNVGDVSNATWVITYEWYT